MASRPSKCSTSSTNPPHSPCRFPKTSEFDTTDCSRIACATSNNSVSSRKKEQAEKVRKELLLEIGRERAKARERAAEQRKQLELEVEETN